MRPILVAGATGKSGREVVRALLARGAPVRAAGRTPGDPVPGTEARVEAALDFDKPETWGPALDGARALYLMRPPTEGRPAKTVNPFLDAARAAGVGHVVFMSVDGAEDSRFLPHRAIEDHLVAQGPDHTILRPTFFAQNFEEPYLHDIREDDRIYLPSGDARIAFIDLHDLGDVAALALTEPGAHRGAAYTLTGPEAVGFDHVADLLTDATGRPIGYERASVLGFVRHRRRLGASWPFALIMARLHVGLRWGEAEAVTDDVPRLLGRPARDMATYVRANADVWRRDGRG